MDLTPKRGRKKRKRKEVCTVAKKRTQAPRSKTVWLIRALILIIVAVALAIGAKQLIEWNQLRKRADELQEQKDALTDGETEDENTEEN